MILGMKSRQLEAVGPGRAGTSVHGILERLSSGPDAGAWGGCLRSHQDVLIPLASPGRRHEPAGAGWQDTGATLSVRLLGRVAVCALHVCSWACVRVCGVFICVQCVCMCMPVCTCVWEPCVWRLMADGAVVNITEDVHEFPGRVLGLSPTGTSRSSAWAGGLPSLLHGLQSPHGRCMQDGNPSRAAETV